MLTADELLSTGKRITISNARKLWIERCSEYAAKNGDVGSCVLGAEIETYYTARKGAKPKRTTLISAHEVTNLQGSCVWESSVKEVLEYLARNGIEATYNPGMMD